MTFLWPWMLLALVLLPVLVVTYRRLLARRARRREALAQLGLVAPAPTRRRHVAPALMLLSLGLLLVAAARPEATIAQPHREGTVVLAFDVSNSMAATDLRPTRMKAAKAAARRFVEREPAAVRIAVVAFGEGGVISQRPTVDRPAVLSAIDRLTPQGGTTLGRGIQTSLSAIAGRTVRVDDPAVRSDTSPGQDIGYYGSAAVVLMTDGENTGESDPMAAAELASTAGVKIYPVGLGTPGGTVISIDGFQVATALDEATLRRIATVTDGTYIPAADSAAIDKVYDAIDLHWVVRGEHIEITAAVGLAAALLLLLAAGLSFAWYGRVV